VAVATAEVHEAGGYHRRGQEHIERIRHHLGGGLGPVQMSAAEAALALGRELPQEFAGGGIESIEIAVEAAEVHPPTG